jgi:uncharacterized membrane-anchored protein YhcB (DUF1043 family)
MQREPLDLERDGGESNWNDEHRIRLAVLEPLQAAIDRCKRDLKREMEDQRVEMSRQFEHILRKIADNNIEAGMDTVAKAFESHQADLSCHLERIHSTLNGTGGRDAIKKSMQFIGHADAHDQSVDGADIRDAVSSVYHLLRENTTEMNNKFEAVFRMVEQCGVNADLHKVMKVIEAQKDEVGSHFDRVHRKLEQSEQHYASKSVLKALQDQRSDLEGFFNQARETVERDSQDIESDRTWKAIDGLRHEMGVQFGRIHKRFEQSESSYGADSSMAAVHSTLQDQREEIDSHFDRMCRRVELLQSKTLQSELGEFLAQITKAVRDIRTEVDLQPVYKWIQVHSSDMASYFGDLNNTVRNISVESEMTALHRTIKELRESLRNSPVDISPIQTLIKDSKYETDRLLTQVVKITSDMHSSESAQSQALDKLVHRTSELDELHSAVCLAIPSKLSEIHSQGEAVAKKVGEAEMNLRTLADKMLDERGRQQGIPDTEDMNSWSLRAMQERPREGTPERMEERRAHYSNNHVGSPMQDDRRSTVHGSIHDDRRNELRVALQESEKDRRKTLSEFHHGFPASNARGSEARSFNKTEDALRSFMRTK